MSASSPSAVSLILQAADGARSPVAERRLLASVLLDPDSCIADGLDEVHAGLFTGGLTLAVWREIAGSRSRGEGIEFALIGGRLKDVDTLEFARLAEEVPSAANFPIYLHELKQAAGKRALLDGTYKAQQLCANGSTKDEMLRVVSESVRQAEDAATTSKPRQLCEVLPEVLAALEAPALDIVPTGFQSLDGILGGGFRPGEMVILAARPSLGKTSLALVLALEAATRGDAVLFVSAEMRSHELALKALSRHAGINPVALRHGNAGSKDALANARRIAQQLAPLRLFLDDAPKSSLQHAKASIIRDSHAIGARLVIVDYLGLIPGDDRRASPYERTSAVSRELKNLARTLSVPVLALAQLNRDVERGAPRDPQLSDLRDSGTIEQDADVVLLLARKAERADGQLVDAIVAKNRNGPTNRVPLLFRPSFSQFESADRALDFD